MNCVIILTGVVQTKQGEKVNSPLNFMTDEELTARLKELAVKLFPSANSWAVKEGVQNICRFMEEINPGEYRGLHRALFVRDATVKPYENIKPLYDRLERLAIRLEDEGRYTDSDICWFSLNEMK